MSSFKFVWREEFKIGIDKIDKEHQQLFKIVNKLFSFQKEEKDRQWFCQEGIKFFREHALAHFANEEAYMDMIHYAGIKQHAKLHRGFRENTLPALEAELEQTQYSEEAVEHFLGVCTGWLIGHTMTEDLAMSGKGIERWEHLLPEEEIEVLKKMIAENVYNMFHLECRLVSDTYRGEKFGKGVYYRLAYGKGKEKERLEVIMIFEESLLVDTVGKILGVKSKKLDDTLVHAARYVTRQFVERVMKHFPALDGYELKEENLLSYEQVERMFEQEKVQASLLFHTADGYFAYCVRAPHLVEDGMGIPLTHQNVTAEVEKYLKEKDAQQKEEKRHPKKKVLVVDDSKMLREMMKDLLDTDYDLSMAESGVGAIRAIALDRPDIVLLDYEMPICDGKQTLEMLRSEKMYADLPVFFLTGKGDAESVKKVMRLKPAGYLLKQLESAVIKKEIDKFFQKSEKE